MTSIHIIYCTSERIFLDDHLPILFSFLPGLEKKKKNVISPCPLDLKFACSYSHAWEIK